MTRVSRIRKQKREAWKKGYMAKRQALAPRTTDPPAAAPAPHSTASGPPTPTTDHIPDTTTLVPPSPQPSTSSQLSTSHTTDITGNDASLLTLRETLLQDIEKLEDDGVSGDEIVMLTKTRLKNLLSSRCSCSEPSFEFTFQPDAYENTITMHCTKCNFNKLSTPEVVKAGRRRTSKIYKTNISLTYLSVIDDIGFAGIRRMMGVLGMKPIGKFKYYRHPSYLFAEMEKHYNRKQQMIHTAIRKHYQDHTINKVEENGVLKLDVSFDWTWMKRGHTSKVGMGVVIEIYTGFIVDYEIMCKYCFHCTVRKNQLKTKKITQEEYNKWKAEHHGDCTVNYEGLSGGMEIEAARRLFS